MTGNPPLVSIIMPAFNASRSIKESIESVLMQQYTNWELLIVNDGSTDNTKAIIESYSDRRIRYFEKNNGGVSSARNLALANMQGEFFCFLDADDLLTPESISSRIQLFQEHDNAGIVDGTVIFFKHNPNNVIRVYQPGLAGRVVKSLAFFSEKVFCMASAMIRREAGISYHFDPLMTHAEDIWFILSVHQQSKLSYASVDIPILYYRKGDQTAMSNLDGLGKGYLRYYSHVKTTKILHGADLTYLKYKIGRIMFLSYIRKRELKKSITYLLTLYLKK